MYVENRKVVGVLVQFNDRVKVVCGEHTPEMTKEDIEAARIREARQDGMKIAEGSRIYLEQMVRQLETSGFVFVSAGWQERTRTAGGSFFTSRYLFVPAEAAEPTNGEMQCSLIDANYLCQKHLWRVVIYANPVIIEGVDDPDAVFITVNCYDRFRLYERDGSLRRIRGENVEYQGRVCFSDSSIIIE